MLSETDDSREKLDPVHPLPPNKSTLQSPDRVKSVQSPPAMSEDEEIKELKEPVKSILSKKSNLKSPNKRKTISYGKSVGFQDDLLIEKEEDTE